MRMPAEDPEKTLSKPLEDYAVIGNNLINAHGFILDFARRYPGDLL
jgi:hypothetical protein